MLDGQTIEDRTVTIAPGAHVLTVTRPGYHDHKESLWLMAEHKLRIHVPLLPTDATELANHMGTYRHEALHPRDVR
jgi:hypothetical protein